MHRTGGLNKGSFYSTLASESQGRKGGDHRDTESQVCLEIPESGVLKS